MANHSLPPKPQSEIWEYCSTCKRSRPRGHICGIGRHLWTRTWTGCAALFKGIFPTPVYCSKCRRNHLPPVCVPSQWRTNVATSALAAMAIVGILYLPLIMRSPRPVVGGGGPVTATPTPIIIGPPLLDMPTATPEPPPTPTQAVR